jgi:hypothetical protein
MPWPELRADDLRHFPLETGAGGSPVLHPSCRTAADGWKRCIDALLVIRELPDDWDGQGTAAPPTEVVDSATILAVMLRRGGVRPPTVTVQGLIGDVAFEWQWADQTTLTLDVDEPFSARLTRVTREGVVTEHPLFEAAVTT